VEKPEEPEERELEQLANLVPSDEVLIICGNCAREFTAQATHRSADCPGCGVKVFTSVCGGCHQPYVASDEESSCPYCDAALFHYKAESVPFSEPAPISIDFSRRSGRPGILADGDADDATA